jgi:uncharacterized membrane protein
MNQRAMIAATAASLMSLSLVAVPASAHDSGSKNQEKCFGVAKAGQNDCGNLSGTHSCAGQAKVDFDKTEWKWVAKGTCKEMGGLTLEDVKKPKG